MGQVHSEILPSRGRSSNMPDYAQAVAHFEWEDVERSFSWYETGKVNMAYEAVDRHVLEGRGESAALLYSDAVREESYTFADLRERSNQFGNVLRKYGIGKGERVFIFMPRQPELYFSLLGILKVGAVAGPLFEAFMESAVKDRLADSGAVALVTTPELLHRVKRDELPALRHIFLVGGVSEPTQGTFGYEEEMAAASTELDLEWLGLDDGLIMHYTSGSTGKPKGVYHVQRAMIQHYYTGKIVLDLQPDDIYWCTADPGWVTGTSYGIFAPWLNGVTNVVRGGRFSPQDWYKTIKRNAVTVWYSAPTAFRMLMGVGESSLQGTDLSSLRHVLSVGEPLNPEVVRWGEKVYHQRIHDTWWMTETGAQLICNYPGMDIKPGSMGRPLPGIEAAILDDRGNVLPPYTMGNLAIRTPWPSMMSTIWNNPAKYEEYFRIPGWYISGDSAYMDEEGYYWFQGRIDDVINSSGERIGPFEVESKLVEHPAVAEAGVIGKPDAIRGGDHQGVHIFAGGLPSNGSIKRRNRCFCQSGTISARSTSGDRIQG